MSHFKRDNKIYVYIEVNNVYNGGRQTRFLVNGFNGTACICIADVNKNVKCSCENISQNWEKVVDPGDWLTYPLLYLVHKSNVLISALITAGPLINISNTSTTKLSVGTSVTYESYQPRFAIKRVDFARYIQSNGDQGNLPVSWDSRSVKFSHTPTSDTVFYALAYTIDIDGFAEVPVPFASIISVNTTTKNLYVRFAPKSIDSSLLNATASVFCEDNKIDEFKPPIGVKALPGCRSASVVINGTSIPIYVQYVENGNVIHECETTTSCDLNQPPPTPTASPPPSPQPPQLHPTGIYLAALSVVSGSLLGAYIGKKFKKRK